MRIALLTALLALSACATGSAEDGDSIADMFAPVSPQKVRQVEAAAAAYPLGSEKNPVRASGPSGERAYLARLRCSDGTVPTVQQRGSVGLGPYGKIMDVYPVTCENGQPAAARIYIDMYHDHVEARPVPGFTIAAR